MCGYSYANTGVFRGVRSPGTRRGRWKSTLCLPPGQLAFSATEPSLQPQSLNFNLRHLSFQNCEEYSSILSNLPSETFCYSSKNGLKSPGLELCEYVTIERVQGIFFLGGVLVVIELFCILNMRYLLKFINASKVLELYASTSSPKSILAYK